MWWEREGLEVKRGELHFAEHKASPIADDFSGCRASNLAQEYGTPLYAYSGIRVLENYDRIKNAFKGADREVRIHYAMKANSNRDILSLLAGHGSFIDAVSPYEVERAIECNFDPEKILYTGTSVGIDDFMRVQDTGARINIDKMSQLVTMKDYVMQQPISVRMNPGVGGAGHSWKTMTAGKEAHGRPIKFGVPDYKVLDVCKYAIDNDFGIVGLHMHVGSQWTTRTELNEFFKAVDKLLDTAGQVTKLVGHELEFVDFGGGPGIKYKPRQHEFPLQEYADGICERVRKSGLGVKAIAIEPGRSIVGDAGILLTRVNYVEDMYGNLIAGVDAGMETLVRPAMYGSYHEIVDCDNPRGKRGIVTIAGHDCESGDLFAPKRKMVVPKEGDLLAVLNAGAYGYTMASRYNLWPMPKEVLVENILP